MKSALRHKLFDSRTISARTSKEKNNARGIEQYFGRVKNFVQCVRHPMSPDVTRDKFSFKIEFANHCRIARSGFVSIQINTIDYDMNFIAIDTARDEILSKGIGD